MGHCAHSSSAEFQFPGLALAISNLSCPWLIHGPPSSPPCYHPPRRRAPLKSIAVCTRPSSFPDQPLGRSPAFFSYPLYPHRKFIIPQPTDFSRCPWTTTEQSCKRLRRRHQPDIHTGAATLPLVFPEIDISLEWSRAHPPQYQERVCADARQSPYPYYNVCRVFPQ